MVVGSKGMVVLEVVILFDFLSGERWREVGGWIVVRGPTGARGEGRRVVAR